MKVLWWTTSVRSPCWCLSPGNVQRHLQPGIWMCTDDDLLELCARNSTSNTGQFQYNIRSKGKVQAEPTGLRLELCPSCSGQWVRKTRQSLSILHVLKDTPVTFQWRNLLRSRSVWSGVTPTLRRALSTDPDICREIILEFQMVLHSTCNVEPQTLCKRLDLDKPMGHHPEYHHHANSGNTSK